MEDAGQYTLHSNTISPKISANHSTCLRNLRSRHTPSLQSPGVAEWEEPHEILKLLNESIHCECTIPHDRIYALLGMAGIHPLEDAKDLSISSSSERIYASLSMAGINTSEDADELSISNSNIRVNYTISLAKLYSRLAMFIIINTGLHAIFVTGGALGPKEGLDLPSWTLDF